MVGRAGSAHGRLISPRLSSPRLTLGMAQLTTKKNALRTSSDLGSGLLNEQAREVRSALLLLAASSTDR